MAARSLEDHCSAARDLMQCDQFEDAVSICRRILMRYPLHVRAYTILGEASLAMGEHAEAANLFRRVLGADPENMIAYAGLGVIYEERGLLEEATWHMERAFELAPYNAGVREALSSLYAQLDVTPRRRLKLTRAALARCYAQGGLYPKAVGEFREIVQDQTDRLDLHVSMVEALWRDEQYEAASAACEGILKLAPNCLKANLITGEICLRDEEREAQGRALLERAQHLDPENRLAQQLFGDRSPLPPLIVPLARAEGLEEEPLPLPEEFAPGERLTTVEDILGTDDMKAPAETPEEPAPIAETPTTDSAVTKGEPIPSPSDLAGLLEQETEIVPTGEPSILVEEVVAVTVIEDIRIGAEEAIWTSEEPSGEPAESALLLAQDISIGEILDRVDILSEERLLTIAIEGAPPTEEILDTTEASAVEELGASRIEEAPLAGRMVDELESTPEEAGLPAPPIEEIPDGTEIFAAEEELVAAPVVNAPPAEEMPDQIEPPTDEQGSLPTPIGETPDEIEIFAVEEELVVAPLEEALPTGEVAEEIETPTDEEVPLPTPIEEIPAAEEESDEIEISAGVDLTPEAEQGQVHAAYLARIEGDPADYSARLELAQVYVRDEQVDDALGQYAELIRSRSGLLNEVTEDLETLISSFPEHERVRELLGDAYMKANRFSDALESYQALLGAPEQTTEESLDPEAS